MCRIIDELAVKNDIKPADANHIFKDITAVVTQKIPELKDVLEDIFEEADEKKLKDHMAKMASIIQQRQWEEQFKNCMMPSQQYNRQTEIKGELF